MVGTKIDTYELIRELGRGAMGVVYLARHTTTARDVALKLLHPDRAAAQGGAAQAALERFQREARAMGAVADSPNVVQVLDAGIDPATQAPFLVMELLKGEDVEELSRRLGPLPVDLCLRIVAQALAGLTPAHAAGIVHRDLKPSNLFLMKRADGECTVKVLDFGIAKLREGAQAQGAAQLTAEGTAVGSPAYMSPEQVQASKALDVRSDIWSMGVVLYQLLSGKLPFAEAETMRDLLMAIVLGRPPPITHRASWVPAAVHSILEKAMQHDPAARFADAGEMRAAIVELLGGASTATAISETMLVPLSAEGRISQLPVSGMVVSVPSALPGSATTPMTAPHAGTMATGAPVAAAGATAPLPAISSGTSSSSAAAAPAAAAAPFAFPTQPSAGVVKPAGRGKTAALVVVGLILAAGLGAGAFAIISQSTDAAPSDSGVEQPPTSMEDAGAERRSEPVAPGPRPDDSADAGAVVAPAPSDSSSAAPPVLSVRPSRPASPTVPANHPPGRTTPAQRPGKVKTID